SPLPPGSHQLPRRLCRLLRTELRIRCPQVPGGDYRLKWLRAGRRSGRYSVGGARSVLVAPGIGSRHSPPRQRGLRWQHRGLIWVALREGRETRIELALSAWNEGRGEL